MAKERAKPKPGAKAGQKAGKDRRQEILAAAAQVITDRGLVRDEDPGHRRDVRRVHRA